MTSIREISIPIPRIFAFCIRRPTKFLRSYGIIDSYLHEESFLDLVIRSSNEKGILENRTPCAHDGAEGYHSMDHKAPEREQRSGIIARIGAILGPSD